MKWLTMRTNRSVFQLSPRGYRSAANNAAIDALFPPRCAICGEIVDKKGNICEACGLKVRYIVSPFCMICGKALDSEERELCQDCNRKSHEFRRGVAAFAYTKELKASMYQFKYNNKREYASFYAGSLAALKGHIIKSWQPEVLMPVPLHRKRYKKRGYNQAALIARELGNLLGIPVDEHSLVRTVNTAPQKTLDDKQRAKNIKNAFQVRNNIVQYKKAVLVDDIYTTGATLDACAAVLKRAGVQQVYFVSVCVGRGF